jgi:hypothetical protein
MLWCAGSELFSGLLKTLEGDTNLVHYPIGYSCRGGYFYLSSETLDACPSRPIVIYIVGAPDYAAQLQAPHRTALGIGLRFGSWLETGLTGERASTSVPPGLSFTPIDFPNLRMRLADDDDYSDGLGMPFLALFYAIATWGLRRVLGDAPFTYTNPPVRRSVSL